ncbi:hypothetical protein LSAT2_005614, partial [Lamellibrachia satsuma]
VRPETKGFIGRLKTVNFRLEFVPQGKARQGCVDVTLSATCAVKMRVLLVATVVALMVMCCVHGQPDRPSKGPQATKEEREILTVLRELFPTSKKSTDESQHNMVGKQASKVVKNTASRRHQKRNGMECPANCAECFYSNLCTMCDEGFVMRNGFCEAEPDAYESQHTTPDYWGYETPPDGNHFDTPADPDDYWSQYSTPGPYETPPDGNHFDTSADPDDYWSQYSTPGPYETPPDGNHFDTSADPDDYWSQYSTPGPYDTPPDGNHFDTSAGPDDYWSHFTTPDYYKRSRSVKVPKAAQKDKTMLTVLRELLKSAARKSTDESQHKVARKQVVKNMASRRHQKRNG